MSGGRKEIRYQIDLYSIVTDTIKNLWLVVLGVIACTMITVVIMDVTYKREYTASVTFAVSSNVSESTYSNLTITTQMADVFTEVFESDTLKTIVDEELGVKTNSKIEASVVTGTNLLVVRSVADSPDVAYSVLQSVIDNYGQLSDYIFSNAVLNVLNSPQVPATPSNSLNVISRIKTASIICVVVLLVIIILLSIIKDTVKNVKQAKRELETEVFETINYESKNKTFKAKIRKSNKSLLLTEPVIGFYFKEAFNRIKVKIEYLSEKKDCKTYLVTSVEENEGKTTIAANIALSLAQNNHKVLLIDADLRKPAIYKVFEEKPDKDKDFVNYLQGNCTAKECLKFDAKNNLYILYSCNSVRNSMELLSSEKMKKTIAAYRKIVDYIIVDSPPMSMVSDTEYLSDIVDASLLVVRQNYSLIADINDSIETLKNSNSNLIGCIINNVRSFNSNITSIGRENTYEQ